MSIYELRTRNDGKIIVQSPQVKAEAVVTVFDKDGNEKGKLRFTNDPEELENATEHDSKKLD